MNGKSKTAEPPVAAELPGQVAESIRKIEFSLGVPPGTLTRATPEQAAAIFGERVTEASRFVQLRDETAELERQGKTNTIDFQVHIAALNALSHFLTCQPQSAGADQDQANASDAFQRGEWARFANNVSFMHSDDQAFVLQQYGLSEEQQRQRSAQRDAGLDQEQFVLDDAQGRAATLYYFDRNFLPANIQISEESMRSAAAAQAIIVEAVMKNASNLGQLIAEADFNKLTSLATSFMTPGEINSITSFVDGSTAMLSSPMEQQLLMIDTFLEALRNFGLELGEEEDKLKEELEDYRKDMDKLGEDLEEARTKFAKELNEMGDETGLKFLADALEGSANPGSAEWDNFWTKERALAFRRALEE